MRKFTSLITIFGIGMLSGCGPGGADFSENIGNGYCYHRNSSMDCFIAPETWNDLTPMIPSKVVLHKSNGRYVTAKREIIQMSESGSRVGSGVFDFWILDTETPKAYGPLSEDEFSVQFKQLNLSGDLALK